MGEVSTQELQHARDIIDQTDFQPVIDRLVYLKKWTRKQAHQACEQYRNFLFLKKKYGDNHSLPPSIDIEEVWHAHILHTKAYCEFSNKVFGHYFHHHPTLSGDLAADQRQFQKLFEETTQNLYFKEFGDYIYAVRPIPLRNHLHHWLGKLKSLLQLPLHSRG